MPYFNNQDCKTAAMCLDEAKRNLEDALEVIDGIDTILNEALNDVETLTKRIAELENDNSSQTG